MSVPDSESKSKALFIYLTLRGKPAFNLFGNVLFREDLLNIYSVFFLIDITVLFMIILQFIDTHLRFIQSLLQSLFLKCKEKTELGPFTTAMEEFLRIYCSTFWQFLCSLPTRLFQGQAGAFLGLLEPGVRCQHQAVGGACMPEEEAARPRQEMSEIVPLTGLSLSWKSCFAERSHLYAYCVKGTKICHIATGKGPQALGLRRPEKALKAVRCVEGEDTEAQTMSYLGSKTCLREQEFVQLVASELECTLWEGRDVVFSLHLCLPKQCRWTLGLQVPSRRHSHGQSLLTYGAL